MLYRELHQATARRAETDPEHELALILLLDKTVMHLEADLRWLDMLESRLDEVRSQPVPQPDLRPRGRPKKKPSHGNGKGREGDEKPARGRHG
jgi:hypothetical protein